MRPIFSLLLLFSLGLLTAHCGGSSSGSKPPANKPPMKLGPDSSGPAGEKKLVGNHFYLAPEIPADQQAALADDLSLIQSFNASTTAAENAEMIRILGVPGVDGSSLYKWLRDRLRYFMGEKLAVYNFAIVYPEEASYGYFKLADESEEEARLTGAINVGAGLYNFGRSLSESEGRNQYLRMQIDQQWQDVTSPRVGIMQIGPALFNLQVNPQRMSAFANSAFRIQILFHEARHSDGNEAKGSLGFTHVTCPDTQAEELRGRAACDIGTNGAYMVGALMLRSYYSNCGNKCTAAELVVLKMLYADAYSRLITSEQRRLDPAPEKGFAATDIANFNRITIQ